MREIFAVMLQSLYLRVCLCAHSLGLKVPAVVDEVKSSLAAGLCVVIGLQSTGEVSCSTFYLPLHTQTERFHSLINFGLLHYP